MPQAIPIILSVAAAAATGAGAAGVGILGATAFTIGTTAITYGAVLGAVLSIAASVAGTLLNKPPDAGRQTIEAGIPQVDPKPPKRLAFGRYKYGGRRVASFTKGRALYSAYLFASHPCEIGTWDLFIDDREVGVWTGDPFDMDEGGKISAPDVLNSTTFWISGGDHTQAPQEWIDDGVISATDRWDGCTMVWIISGGVEPKDFNKKYPNGANREVQLLCDGGLWTDPVTQTEAHSATPAVIGFALMQHEYGLGYDAGDIEAATFADGAIVEQAGIDLADGGTHPRYEMNGVIDLTGDRGDFIAAVQAAAASEIVLQGGKWAYLPGVARQSVMTLDQDRLAGPPRFTLIGESDQRYNAVEGSFVDPVFFTAATNPLYQDAAALATDGEERLSQPQHPHVTHPVQAQRLDRLGLRFSRRQKSVSAPFTGRAIFLTEGDVVTTNFGLPFWEDGSAIVRKAKLEVSEIDGVPVETNVLDLREYNPTDYDWSASDEQAYVPPVAASSEIETHDAPATVSVVWSGGGSTRAVELSVPRDDEAYSLEWEYSLNSGVDWVGLAEVVIRDEDPVILRQEALQSGATVRWRIRNSGGERLNSPWKVTPDYTVPGAQPLPEPVGTVDSTTSTSITINWAIPDDARIDMLEIYRINDQTEPDPLQGTRIALLTVTPDTTETYTDSSLTSDDYRYWARCYDSSVSGQWSDVVDQTL